jgi:hypothetical protein
MVGGAMLAAHHPLWPGTVLALFFCWVLVAARRPHLWPLVLLVGLPLLDFSPWSGWFGIDEFDLLVLGAIAGGHARLAQRAACTLEGEIVPLPPLVRAAVALFVVATLVALWRGLLDAGGFGAGGVQSYVDPMNTWRVFKPVLLVLLLISLVRVEVQSCPKRLMRRVGAGMWFGLTVVGLAVLWERIAYPGFADFSAPYRAVGLFWEMHVGGAAIDAYLAMAAPFAAWALWSARTPLRWSIAAVVALLAAYACLTTFSARCLSRGRRSVAVARSVDPSRPAATAPLATPREPRGFWEHCSSRYSWWCGRVRSSWSGWHVPTVTWVAASRIGAGDCGWCTSPPIGSSESASGACHRTSRDLSRTTTSPVQYDRPRQPKGDPASPCTCLRRIAGSKVCTR